MTTEDPSATRRPHDGVLGTRELLDALATGDPEDHLRLDDILAGLSRQVFGMLLFVSTLPAYLNGLSGKGTGGATPSAASNALFSCMLRSFSSLTIRSERYSVSSSSFFAVRTFNSSSSRLPYRLCRRDSSSSRASVRSSSPGEKSIEFLYDDRVSVISSAR